MEYAKLNKLVKTINPLTLGKLKGYLINDRYEIWEDGVCFSLDGKDIPLYVFETQKILFGENK